MNKCFYVLLFVAVLCQSCMPTQLLFKNVPGLSDFKNFPTHTLPKAKEPFQFEFIGFNELPPVEEWLTDDLAGQFSGTEDFLKKTATTSFMVVQNDTVVYENYFNGYLMDKPAVVFSVTKSIVTTLLAQAIADGDIESLQEPAYKYIPELAGDGKEAITLEHLVHMTSGLDFADEEDLLKLGKAYWTKDVNAFSTKVKLAYEPGTQFKYKSVDTQLLSMCIAKATGKPLSEYLGEKIWQPLGMEYDSYFTLDRPGGAERAFGGLAMCTRDLAKIARLFLNEGYWGEEQLIPQQYVQGLGDRDVAKQGWWGYKFGWWMDSYIDRNLSEIRDYYATGYKGQYIYVNPEENIIIIRQGKKRDGVKWAAVMSKLAQTMGEKTQSVPRFTVEDFNGRYQAEDGSILKVKYNEETGNWVVTNTQQKMYWQSFVKDCPMSLENKKRNQRILFCSEQKQIAGLHLDVYPNKATYYTKVSTEVGSMSEQ